MQGVLEAGLLVFLVLAKAQSSHSESADNGQENFLIRYKNGDDVVPVSVRIDYKEGTGYVLSLSQRNPDKAVTFYDFNKRMIAFKHLPSQNCFIMRMKDESINREQKTLESFKNEVIIGTDPLVFYASRESLNPSSLSRVAGSKITRFCHRTKAYLITSNINRGRPKRQVDEYTQRSYNHFGHQTQSYSNHGHDRVTNGRSQPQTPPPFNSRGLPTLSPSGQQNGSPGNPQASYGNGYDAYQQTRPTGDARASRGHGSTVEQTPSSIPQEQVLRFPVPPSQNGDGSTSSDPRLQSLRVLDPRTQDPRLRDPRYQDPRLLDPRMQDPRARDPRLHDPRVQDPRTWDPRYRSTDLRFSGPYQTSTDRDQARSRDEYRRSDQRSTHHRGAVADSDSLASAGGMSADSIRRDAIIPIGLRNITLTFNKFDADSSLSGTGILSNTKVNVDNSGTNAVATSTGQLNEQRSQSQVQGNYAGAGSFSAQAQAGFLHGTSQSQVRGGSDGGSSLSSANVERLGSAQSQVQLGTPDGKSTGSAQGNFARGGTQAEAQGSRDAGTAAAQAQSPGLSQSSASVNTRGESSPRDRFLGEVAASTRGDHHSGVSNTNLQGGYGPDKTYTARAEGSFNSQSSYSPFSGLPPIGDGTDDSRREDIPPDYRYDPQGRDRLYPDFRYPASTTPSSYGYPTSEQDPRYPSPDSRRSGVLLPDGPRHYRGDGRQGIFPPRTPDINVSIKGPTGSSYDDSRRTYLTPTQTKSDIPQPPPRAYVHPDQSRRQPPPQTKSQPSYPRASSHPDLSIQSSTSHRSVSCCRVRREQFHQCCQLVPHAECCSGGQKGQQTRPRRYLSDERQKDDDCQPTCYTVYKTIGQARICQPSSNGNC